MLYDIRAGQKVTGQLRSVVVVVGGGVSGGLETRFLLSHASGISFKCCLSFRNKLREIFNVKGG